MVGDLSDHWAVQAGWDEAVAVEREPIYNEMAEARIRATLGTL